MLIVNMLNDITPPASGGSSPDDTIIYIVIAIIAFVVATILFIKSRKERKMEDNMNELRERNGKLMPIRCPNCGGVELAFVTYYKKALLLRAICLISALLAVFIFVFYNLPALIKNNSTDYTFCVICAVVSILFWIAYHCFESETHVQAICRSCGYIWLLT